MTSSPTILIGIDPSSALFECPICDRGFSRGDTLRSHIVKKHGNSMEQPEPELVEIPANVGENSSIFHPREQLIACPHCTCVYMSPENLQEHVKRVHETAKQHECERCGRKYRKRKNLLMHQKTCQQV